jgi:hypothetical protein
LGWVALQRRLDGRVGIDHAEVELGGLAEQLLEPGRVLQAWHLHQNAVGALPLNERLDGAELVDAAFDDLDRLFDRLANAFDHGRLGHREPDQAVGVIADIEAALTATAEDAAQRQGQFPQLGERGVETCRLADAHLDGAATHRQAGITDPRVAQHAAHVVAQRFEHVLAHGLGVDFEQDVRTALQIEPEHNVALRPFRTGLHHLLGQEIRHGEQADDQCRQHNRRRLPPREIKHEVPTL